MAFDPEVFVNQYLAVESFVQYLAYYRGVSNKMDSLTHSRAFWESVRNGHLKLATIAWCRVFGANREHLHWKRALRAITLKWRGRIFVIGCY